MPNNIAKILAQDPGILSKPDSPSVGPARPVLLGRAAVRLLPTRWTPGCSAATPTCWPTPGIDTVIFDTTNARHLSPTFT